jgi:hypothetical protein
MKPVRKWRRVGAIVWLLGSLGTLLYTVGAPHIGVAETGAAGLTALPPEEVGRRGPGGPKAAAVGPQERTANAASRPPCFAPQSGSCARRFRHTIVYR